METVTIPTTLCPDCGRLVLDAVRIGPGRVLLDPEPSPKGIWAITVDGRAGLLGSASVIAYRVGGRLWQKHTCAKKGE